MRKQRVFSFLFLTCIALFILTTEKSSACSKELCIDSNIRSNANPQLDVESYDLRGHFDWETLSLIAEVDITLRTGTPEPTLILDSYVTSVQSVRLKTGEELPFQIAANHSLVIDLNKLTENQRQERLTITIKYETKAGGGTAGEEVALDTVTPREGDPVTAKAVYTNSEPQAAAYWLPCHNTPSDRALFSTDFTLPSDEVFVSNGALQEDSVQGTTRRVRYKTDYPLPTYLMAFAIGEFQTQTVMHGKLPVSLVWRRGLALDAASTLKMLNHQITVYENLIVPYPFEKYSLVLLPEFPGSGIEHAGITFQDEAKSSDFNINEDYWLSAHELAHQWFGDLVTVKTWDDLWFKEGLADLMAQEARRSFEDTHHTGRLLGSNHHIVAGEAIIDPDLAPEQKYTSGPYARSAWLFTQIRSLIGEKTFWSRINQILVDYRFSAIGTEDVLNYFKQDLSSENLAKVRLALKAKALPKFKLLRSTPTEIEVEFTDPEGAMAAPLDIAWYQSGAEMQKDIWQPSTKKTFPLDPSFVLLLDSNDTHPVMDFEFEDNTLKLNWLSAFVPKTSKNLNLLLKVGNQHVSRALEESKYWKLTPDVFSTSFQSLSSESAKFEFILLGCELASQKYKEDPERASSWKNALTKAIFTKPTQGINKESHGVGFSSCEPLFSPPPFGTLWAEITKNPSQTNISDSDLLYLSLFAQSPQKTFEVWSPIGLSGASVRKRALAIKSLTNHLLEKTGFDRPSAEEQPQWKQYFRKLIQKSQPSEIIDASSAASVLLQDYEALPLFHSIARSSLRYKVRKNIICQAYKLTKATPEVWKKFVQDVESPDPLPDYLHDYLMNPEKCLTHED